MYLTPIIKQSVVSCRICSVVVCGWKLKNRWVSLRLTNAGLRTIDKNGIDAVLFEMRARGENV